MAKPQKPNQKPKAKALAKVKARVGRLLSLPDGLLGSSETPRPRRRAEPTAVPAELAGAAILDQLWDVVEQRRLSGDTEGSHSARLLARGTAKVAQKLGEEAVECVIEAALARREPTVLESADLLYHLVVVWVDAGIRPGEVWTELARRQGLSGIAEKAARPKRVIRAARTTKLP